MPCRDDGPCDPCAADPKIETIKKLQIDLEQVQVRLNKVTKLLCFVMKKFEENKESLSKLSSFIAEISFNLELTNWWNDHKSKDNQRHLRAKKNLPNAMKIIKDLPKDELKALIDNLRQLQDED